MSSFPASGAKNPNKQRLFANLKNLVLTNNKILIVNADNVRSDQFAKIRYALRGKATIVMGKNTMIKTCIRSLLEQVPNYESILELIQGNIGLVFCHDEPSEVKKIIAQFKVPAPARQGAVAPCDVIVPPGPTGMDPGQTSFFQSLSIATKIVKGQIEIQSDVHLIRKGEKVNASQATLLNKLNIRPFTYGLECITVFEDGVIYPASLLDISEEDILSSVISVISMVSDLSCGASVPNELSVPYYIMNSFREMLGVSLVTNISDQSLAPYLKDLSVA